jgi:hypothetical protein
MPVYGIKIARPGFNADDPNIAAKDLSFSSLHSTPKLYRCISFTAIGDTSHGLDYSPAFFVTFKTTASSMTPDPLVDQYICTSFSTTAGSILITAPLIEVDDTYVKCVSIGDASIVYVTLAIDPIDE